MSELSSPPASDLAAARERLAALCESYDDEALRGDHKPIRGMTFHRLGNILDDVRLLLSSLGDGDDSARLEGLDAELRKQGASWRSSFRAWGHDFTLFEDGWHVAVDAISNPIIDGADLRSAIDAARTAPGGANAATR